MYESFGLKDSLIEEIRQIAIQNNINSVILFGSRARGDYKVTSDIDLACSGGDIAKFAIDVDEYTNTLLFYDVVNLDVPTQKELIDSIETDGILIYEKA